MYRYNTIQYNTISGGIIFIKTTNIQKILVMNPTSSLLGLPQSRNRNIHQQSLIRIPCMHPASYNSVKVAFFPSMQDIRLLNKNLLVSIQAPASISVKDGLFSSIQHRLRNNSLQESSFYFT